MESKRALFRIGLAAILLAAAVLACGLPSFQQVDAARATAAYIATKVQQGNDLLSTGQAVVTQMFGSGPIQTARALITEQGPALAETAMAFATQNAPLLETAQALATEYGPSVLETAQAIATQAPSLLVTLQAAATEQGPGAAATAQAVVTEFASSTGEVPADIPILSDASELFASQVAITYYTSVGFQQALDFYTVNMPANGWIKDEQASFTSSDTALLVFTKGDKRATVSLTYNPVSAQTFVALGIR